MKIRLTSLLLSFLLLFTSLWPTVAAARIITIDDIIQNQTLKELNLTMEARKNNSETFVEEHVSASESLGVSNLGEKLSSLTQNETKNTNQNQIAEFRKLNLAMQQIITYFYPKYRILLTEEQQLELNNWNEEEVKQRILNLDKGDQDKLDLLFPIVLQYVNYYTNRLGYSEKYGHEYSTEEQNNYEESIKDLNIKTTEKALENINKISMANSNEYHVSPFKNEYNYSIQTNELVDPLYRTANENVLDLSLSGKEGLDITIERRYNSLQSNVLDADYTTYSDSGYYYQAQGNKAVTQDLNKMLGYIATGWSMNLPGATMANIEAEIAPWTNSYGCYPGYQGTTTCYNSGYSYKSVAAYEKVLFSLEDGSKIEFRNGVPYDYPYQNVSYSKSLNATTGKNEYQLTVNEKITYRFNDQGEVLNKTNQYGEKIVYSYENNNEAKNIVITDSYGRKITIYRNADSVITGFKVEDGTTVIKQVEYNTVKNTTNNVMYRKWTSSGYTNVTENLSYYQLVDVKDKTDLQNIKMLATYDYYSIDSTKLADFNMKPDYAFNFTGPNGEMVIDPNKQYYSSAWTWAADESKPAQAIEFGQVTDANRNSYGEIPFLLLKNINYLNNVKVTFNYQNYNTAWSQQSNIVDQENVRGSTRLFQDKHALQYLSYHPVESVGFAYVEQDKTKLITTYYNNIHLDHGQQFNEYWKNDLTNINRLKNSSRFGHQQTIETKSIDASGNYNRTYKQYLNNGQDYILGASWDAGYGSSVNKLRLTENGFVHDYVDIIKTYDYEAGKKLPIREVEGSFSDVAWLIVLLPSTQIFKSSNYSSTAVKQISEFTYDNWGLPLSVKDPIGNVTTYQYNGPFHDLSKTVMNSADNQNSSIQETTFYPSNDSDINKRNQVWKTTLTNQYKDPVDSTVAKADVKTTELLAYNDEHKAVSAKSYASGSQYGGSSITLNTFSYTSRGQLKTQSSQAMLGSGQTPTNLTNTYEYYPNGQLKQMNYPDQSVSSYKYDFLNRKIEETFTPTNGQPRTTSITYDDTLRKVSVKLPDGEIQDTFYSPFGLAVKEQRTVNGMTRVININNNNDGKTVTSSVPYADDSLKTTYTYDNLLRTKTVTNAQGQVITYSYSNNAKVNQPNGLDYLQNTNQVVYPDGRIVRSFYDPYGRLTKVDEKTPDGSKNRITSYVYSTSGKMIQSTITSGGKTETTQYRYDGEGNLIYLKDSLGQNYQYVYNRFGAMLSQSINGKVQKLNVYNELGWPIVQKDAAGMEEKYQYNSSGLIQSYADRNGQVYQYSYTPYYEQNRLSITKGSTEVYWKQNEYDPATRLLTSVSNSDNETLAYHWDNWKRNDKKTVAGKTYVIGYDGFDRMTSITFPDNKQIMYSYDNINRVKTVNYPDMGLVNVNYTTSSNANMDQVLYPNQLSQTRTVDAFKDLKSMNHFNNSSTSNWSENYTQDGFGNIVNIDRNKTAYSFTYDLLNRIQSETLPTASHSYKYDDQGNRTSFETTSTVLNQLFVPQTFSYNALNQLKAYSDGKHEAAYTYYGDGLRATKTVDGILTRYVYIEGRIVEELDANGNTKARNIWGNKLLYRKDFVTDKGGYYFYNGHGDVVKIIDGGNLLNSYDYDIWGNLLSKTESITNPFKYSGEVFDEESSLYYLRARYYKPSDSRFISEDTYDGDITNPLSLNLYTYVENNPLIYTDPTGHEKDSDLDPLLINMINQYTNAYNQGDKDAEKLADWTRVLFYQDRNLPIPSDVRYTNITDAGFRSFYDDWLPIHDNITELSPSQFAGGFDPEGYYAAKSLGGFSLPNRMFKNSCNCFVPGTIVQTDAGDKNIEDIEVGDKVLSKDENNSDGEPAYKEVTGLYRNQRADIIKLYVGEHIIKTTDNHPFWVEEKGWMFADELQVGDKLQKADKSNLTIDKVEFVKLDEPITVYNFTVADYHTYYVTDIGIWVHNTECSLSPKTLSTMGRTNTGNSGLEGSYISKNTAMSTATEFVGEGYTKGIGSNGYTTFVSSDGRYVARYGYKRNGSLELNLEDTHSGGNFHIKVK